MWLKMASAKYKVIKLPEDLANLVDMLIDEGKMGYKTRTEFVKDATRRLLRRYGIGVSKEE